MARSRRDFLLSGGSAALLGSTLLRATESRAQDAGKHLIVVVVAGGWDVSFCLDPKLGLPTVEGPEVDATGEPDDVEATQTFSDIEVVVNAGKRPAVGRWFERWGSQAHVVNGIWMGSIGHDSCRYRILSGLPLGNTPDVATIAGAVHGASAPLGTMDLSAWSLPGNLAASTGRIGFQCQLEALLSPTTRFGAPPDVDWTYPIFDMDPADEDLAAEYLRARAVAFGAARVDGGVNDARIADLLQSRDRGERFRAQSVDIVKRLTLGSGLTLPRQIDVAVDLLAANLCRTVTLDSQTRWDTHERNVDQHGSYESLFSNLDLLAARLDESGMLDNTVVAVLSEMTRSPRLNSGAGKDHWPHTSALFFGGGVRGGARTGATTEQIESLPVDLQTGEPDSGGAFLRYDSLCAGLLEHLDVDPEEWLPGVEAYRGFHGG